MNYPAISGLLRQPIPQARLDKVQRNFERRKLALGDCGRAYGTSCIHEHSCIRCPMLRVDPAQRHRLRQIRDSLTARIAEAEREGWTGEAEGLKVSLAAADARLAETGTAAARRTTAADLGMPAYRDIAGRLTTGPAQAMTTRQSQTGQNIRKG